MKTKPIKAPLKVHDRIVQVKYALHETMTVFKIDEADPDRVYLMRENGVALQGSQSAELLRDFDYQLITEGE